MLGVKATEMVISALDIDVTSSWVISSIGQPGVRMYRIPFVRNMFTSVTQAVKWGNCVDRVELSGA